MNDVSCLLFSLISPPNHRKIRRNTCPDGIWWLRGALCLAMRALGEQFGVVEGSSGAKMGVQGCPNEKFGDVGVPPGAPKSTKRTPKTPPGAPKRSPREPPNTRKSIIRSQTLIFRKSSPAAAKSRFLRVGGTAWEVKIDTRRVQDKKRKHFKYDCKRRNEKRYKYGRRRSRTKVCKMLVT